MFWLRCCSFYMMNTMWKQLTCVLAIVVCFVPIWIYKIFRHWIYGVEQKNVDLTLKTAKKCKNLHLFGRVWFYVDYDARALTNKFFFYRIKKA